MWGIKKQDKPEYRHNWKSARSLPTRETIKWLWWFKENGPTRLIYFNTFLSRWNYLGRIKRRGLVRGESLETSFEDSKLVRFPASPSLPCDCGSRCELSAAPLLHHHGLQPSETHTPTQTFPFLSCLGHTVLSRRRQKSYQSFDPLAFIWGSLRSLSCLGKRGLLRVPLSEEKAN